MSQLIVFILAQPLPSSTMKQSHASVTLSRSGGWFEDVVIPLNSGLVSIVGQKGSGKSALAELISFAAGSWDSEEPGSFINRASEHLAGLGVLITWADGRKSNVELGTEPEAEQEVRYLSQRFVERLCADDRIGTELVREIEAVIFSYLDPTDTLNASNFDELRTIRTEGIRAEGDGLRDDVLRLIREECALRDIRSKLPEKEARLKVLVEERAGLVKQIPKAASPEEEKLQQELQLRRNELSAVQQAVALDKQQIQKIDDIRMRLSTFQSQDRSFLI